VDPERPNVAVNETTQEMIINTGTLTLKFTDDLPNGPYVMTTTPTALTMFIQQKATLLEVKDVFDRWGATSRPQLPSRLYGRNGRLEVKTVWTLQAISFKGGVVPFEKPLNEFVDGELLALQIKTTTITRLENPYHLNSCVIL